MPARWLPKTWRFWPWRALGHAFLSAVTEIPTYFPRLLDFWISLVGLASFIVLVWIFDLIGDHFAKGVFTAIYAVMPVLFFMNSFTAKQERSKCDLSNIGLTTLSVAALLIVLFDRIGFPAAAISVASILASLAPLWLFWLIAKRRWLLWFAVVPSTIAACLYLVTPITPTGVVMDYLLVPLPVLLYVCVAWALATKWFLVRAERWQSRRVLGPAMESLSMLFLFVPVIVLTMLAVNSSGFDDTWVGVSGVLVGIIFRNAISVPVRQFLLEIGNLSPNGQCEDE